MLAPHSIQVGSSSPGHEVSGLLTLPAAHPAVSLQAISGPLTPHSEVWVRTELWGYCLHSWRRQRSSQEVTHQVHFRHRNLRQAGGSSRSLPNHISEQPP